MDVRRAQEIIAGPDTIEVLYHREPVWLENVHDGSTVRVSFVKSKEKLEVPVEQLEEQ